MPIKPRTFGAFVVRIRLIFKSFFSAAYYRSLKSHQKTKIKTKNPSKLKKKQGNKESGLLP